jgi:hypothetical protein
MAAMWGTYEIKGRTSELHGPNQGNTFPFIIRYRLAKVPVRCDGYELKEKLFSYENTN